MIAFLLSILSLLFAMGSVLIPVALTFFAIDWVRGTKVWARLMYVFHAD